MAFESFAQCLLSPFRGVMHTLRHESAEAGRQHRTDPCPGAQRLGQLSEARRQASRVDQQYRLYPDGVDESMITAAQVEAAMRRSQEPSAGEKDDTLPPFYIELGPEEEELA